MHVGYGLLTLFPGHVGGSESNARGLLGEFAKGNGPERVTVLANDMVMGAYADCARGPVSLHHVRSYRPGRSSPARALAMTTALLAPRRAARDVPPGLDVVHFPVTVPIPRTGLPEVVTLYDLQHHDLPQFFSAPERALRRLTYDRAAREAAVVVTTSEYSRRRIVDVLGVPPQRVEVVHIGVDLNRFSPHPQPGEEATREALGLPERFVLYPANLWPHKNHVRLVDALAAAEARDVSLLLTGQTYGRLEGLLEHARARGVAERVRHLGYVEDSALPALYRSALGLVFPSLYEGFGTPPLEAMACGCPVAASRRGALDEVCADAVVEIDPESVESIAAALDRLVSDTELRERLRAVGPERAAKLSWVAAAERHKAIYERATAT